MALMGPSGSGKSTLLHLIAAIDRPSSGTVTVLGESLQELSDKEIARWRNEHVGFVFQTFNLIPVMTPLENVTLPMIFAGMSGDQAVEKGRRLLGDVGLGERFLHKPSELSGGQQQRVAIARALANDPAIILADEPTGNLDSTTGGEIIALLQKMSRERKVTIISATHDFKMLSVSDRVVWILDGRIDKIEHRDELKISLGTIQERHETTHP